MSNIENFKWSSSQENFLDFHELENEINNLCDKDELKEMLQLQLNEIEMLQSMYPNPGEFNIDDYSSLVEIDDYVNNRVTDRVPACLDFNINLTIMHLKLQLCCTFPHEYPLCEPEIYVRSDNFTRVQQNLINRDLDKYILSLDRGELCVGQIIYWLQENALNYLKENQDVSKKVNQRKDSLTESDSGISELSREESSRKNSCSLDIDDTFSRYWIYSHHIFSKIKRREIIALALDYSLTGFTLPGRPGIICVEGLSKDCNDCWQRIRAMSWKRIFCKNIETEVLVNPNDLKSLRKFSDFKEISFLSSNLKHMDMGEFYKFLEQHKCAQIFKEFFGIDGKSS